MRRILIAAMLLGLAGCAGKHFAKNADKLSVEDMVNHVQCEVREAWYSENNHKILISEKWIAGVTLTLQESQVGSINPTLTAGTLVKETPPIFLFGSGLNFSEKRKQQSVFSFAIRINDIDPAVCDPRDNHAVLAGRIGVAKVVNEALLALKTGAFTRSLDLTKEKTFGKSMEFEITRGISATGATFQLKNFEGPGNFLTASRTNTNIVDISFTKQAKGEEIEQTARRAQESNINLEIKRIRREAY
jgi:hypothetical protein